jgi:hypothetical protein
MSSNISTLLKRDFRCCTASYGLLWHLLLLLLLSLLC